METIATIYEKLNKPLQEEDIDKLEKIIRCKHWNLGYWQMVLKLACHKDVSTGTIRFLLGCMSYEDRITLFDQHSGQILLYALEGQNPQVLEVIYEQRPGIVWVSDGETALHALSKQTSYRYDEERFLECAKFLIAKGVDVNLRDRNCFTALDWAIEYGHMGLVELLLDTRIVDIDTNFGNVEGYTFCKPKLESTRKTLKQLEVDTCTVPPYSTNNTMYKYLMGGEQEKFIQICTSLREIYCQDFFMEVAVKQNLTEIVKYLYSRASFYSKKFDLLEYTLYKNFEMFKSLLPSLKHNVKDVFMLLSEYFNSNFSEEEKRERYKFLMEFYKPTLKFLSEQDILELLCNLQDDEIFLDLLDRGVPLALRGSSGKFVFRDMRYDVVEKFLDSCITKRNDHYNDIYCLCYSKVLPPVVEKTHFSAEFEILNFIKASPRFTKLFGHPLIHALIKEKWARIRRYFYMNLIISLILSALVLSHIFCYYVNEDVNPSPPLNAITIVITILIFLKEVHEFIISPRLYIESQENISNLIICLLTFFVMFQYQIAIVAKLQVSAFLILNIAFNFFLLLGNFERFSRNSAMFQTVSLEYMRFIIYFSLPIVGFALSFHVLFGLHNDQVSFFSSWYQSLFKTFVMLTGELEAENIDFENSSASSYFIFSFFIFSIVIILSNLLNGLAISDVEKIKSEADLLILLTRVRYMYRLETVLFTKVVHMRPFFEHWKRKVLVFQGKSDNQILVTEKCFCPISLKGHVNFFNARMHTHSCKFRKDTYINISGVDRKLMLQIIGLVNRIKNAKQEKEHALQRKAEELDVRKKLQKIEATQDEIRKNLVLLQEQQGKFQTTVLEMLKSCRKQL